MAKTTLFSGFLLTMLLTFLSFSLFLMQQTPRAIVVKCDGSVYDVDVEVGRLRAFLAKEITISYIDLMRYVAPLDGGYRYLL